MYSPKQVPTQAQEGSQPRLQPERMRKCRHAHTHKCTHMHTHARAHTRQVVHFLDLSINVPSQPCLVRNGFALCPVECKGSPPMGACQASLT